MISLCVGAIIKNDLGEYLTLYRLKSPIGLALPAGHVNKGENPGLALIREVKEETEIEVICLKLVLEKILPSSSCHRGHKIHRWFVYQVTKWRGEPINKEPTKHAFVQFLRDDEIKNWVKRGEYDPVWFREILPDLGI